MGRGVGGEGGGGGRAHLLGGVGVAERLPAAGVPDGGVARGGVSELERGAPLRDHWLRLKRSPSVDRRG